MCCRSRLCLRGDVLSLFGLSMLPGMMMFLGFPLLEVMREVVIPDSSKVLKAVQQSVFFLFISALVEYVETQVAFASISGIMDHIQQVVISASFHKDLDESREEKASKCSCDVGEFAESILWPLHDLGVAFGLIVCSAGFFLWHCCSNVWVILALIIFILIKYFIEKLSYKCEKSFHSSGLLNTNSDSFESVKGRWQSFKGKKKFTLRESAKKSFIGWNDIVDKFLPTLTALLLVVSGAFAQEFLLIGIVLFSSLSDGLCKMVKIICKSSEMRECTKVFRSTMEGNKASSESEWCYLRHLLWGTGQFVEPKKDRR